MRKRLTEYLRSYTIMFKYLERIRTYFKFIIS